MKKFQFFPKKNMNKKGAIWLIAWLIPATLAGAGYLINSTKPRADPNSVAGIISSLPTIAWIIFGLMLMVWIISR